MRHMMLYIVLVLVALSLTVNGAKKRMQVSVVLKYVLPFGSLERFFCCSGNFTLKLVLEKGMSEWVQIEGQTVENIDEQIKRNKYHVPLGVDDTTSGSPKGFVFRYTKAAEDGEERYVSEHADLGFQGILQMKVSPTKAQYPKTEPACKFTTKKKYTSYTVVCLLKETKRNPSWMRQVKKEFPTATYFESQRLPDLTGGGMKGAEMSSQSGVDYGLWT